MAKLNPMAVTIKMQGLKEFRAIVNDLGKHVRDLRKLFRPPKGKGYTMYTWTGKGRKKK